MDFDFRVKLFSGLLERLLLILEMNCSCKRQLKTKGHRKRLACHCDRIWDGSNDSSLVFGNVSRETTPTPASTAWTCGPADFLMGKCFTIHRCSTSWSYVWTIGCRCDSPSIYIKLILTTSPRHFSFVSNLDKELLNRKGCYH